ncbi:MULTISPECIES: triose-phosphate isomerase [Flavobacterium]|uniref:Triosephosphate isomerase n=2 Tax=Flavobacterium TaxID=237 RepID=A0A437UAD8_9FLAO|nr:MULTISPECIES: triose-phosphate isomerase [Flavobacterium]OWP85117.1 triose-phosphate isomerase [Flavobacterium davisii]QYS89348.1 triose-phosphate isomerase [Flavobacterium davisii]RVU90561.1 triose-phosphate isomerase [Flavobacterium columnare]SPE77794.1 Bifunctional PGK/TIM [Flavobacterium columnare]
MRQKIVAGNWKMNKNAKQTNELIADLITNLPETDAKIIIAPTFVNLAQAVQQTNETTIEVAAQNMHQAEGGAFTGEISADMLTNIGVQTVILGHSERRAYFHETDALLANKVNTALKHKMKIIFCFGEELKHRQDKQHFNVVEYQLKDALFHLNASDWKNIILAYEPVWAIGTGETATPEQAQEMHKYIRETIIERYGNEVAQDLSILYGGSVKPDNAQEIFSQADVDGGLIGGASLTTTDFVGIIKGI